MARREVPGPRPRLVDRVPWKFALALAIVAVLVVLPDFAARGAEAVPAIVLFWAMLAAVGYFILREVGRIDGETQREIQHIRKTPGLAATAAPGNGAESAGGQVPRTWEDAVDVARRELEEYHSITKGQARKSFLASIVAMTAGLVVFLAAVAVLLGTAGPRSDLTAVSLVGGAVSQVVGALYLRVYERSVAQMRHFHDRLQQLHDTLLAIRLAEDAGEARPMLQSIVVRGLMARADGSHPTAPPGADPAPPSGSTRAPRLPPAP